MSIKLLQDTADELGELDYPQYMFNAVGDNIKSPEFLTAGGEAAVHSDMLNGKAVVVRVPKLHNRGYSVHRWQSERASRISFKPQSAHAYDYSICRNIRKV